MERKEMSTKDEEEMHDLMVKLNEAIENADERLRIKGDLKGILILRFYPDKKMTSMTSLGKVCPHCLEVAASEIRSRFSKNMGAVFVGSIEDFIRILLGKEGT